MKMVNKTYISAILKMFFEEHASKSFICYRYEISREELSQILTGKVFRVEYDKFFAQHMQGVHP